MSVLLIILVFLAILIGHLLLKNYEIQLFGGNPPSKSGDFMSTMSVSLIPGGRHQCIKYAKQLSQDEKHPCPFGPASCSSSLKVPYSSSTTTLKNGEVDELTAMKDELAEFIGVSPKPVDNSASSQGPTSGPMTLIRPDSQFVTTSDGSVAYIEGSALHRPIREHPNPSETQFKPTLDATDAGDFAAANFAQYDGSIGASTGVTSDSTITPSDELGVFTDANFGSFATWK
jgi:hypothetical protein